MAKRFTADLCNSTDRIDHVAHLMGAPAQWERIMGATNANTTVRQEDFEEILARLKEIQERELILGMDLINSGLTVDVDIDKTVITVDNEGDMGNARVDLNVAQLDDDQTVYGQTSTLCPIVHKSYHIPFRQEGFAYKKTTGERRSMRSVMDKTETLITNGDTSIVATVNGAAQKLYGYTTHPNRTTRTISDWTAATTNVLTNTISMVGDLFSTNGITAKPGSVMMYVANNIWSSVMKQQAFSGKGQNTFHAQILSDNPEIGAIKPAEKLADDNVLMVVMEDQYVQMGIAQAPIVVPHIKTVDLAPQRYTTYAVWTPIIHSDNNSLTGIVHGST